MAVIFLTNRSENVTVRNEGDTVLFCFFCTAVIALKMRTFDIKRQFGLFQCDSINGILSTINVQYTHFFCLRK